MKDDKICFSKTLTYLVLLVAVVFGAFWMMNYANTQKLNQNSKASEPNTYKPNAADNRDCAQKTGDSSSNCSVLGCGPIKKYSTGTSIDGSNVNMDTYNCALNGVTSYVGGDGRCCVARAYVPAVPVPTSSGVRGPAPVFCSSLRGKIARLPYGEVPRYNKIINRYFAGLQVYNGVKRNPVAGQDLTDPKIVCKFDYRTCMSKLGGKSDFSDTTVCYTPSYFKDLTKSQQGSTIAYCTGLAGKIAHKVGAGQYRVFNGEVLEVPQFDQRFAIDNNSPAPAAYCALDVSDCQNDNNRDTSGTGDKCQGYQY